MFVLVATIRALRHHGGAKKEAYNTPHLERVADGFKNLEKHIENVRKFNIEPVVAINSFASDTEEEVQFVIQKMCCFGCSSSCI